MGRKNDAYEELVTKLKQKDENADSHFVVKKGHVMCIEFQQYNLECMGPLRVHLFRWR